MQLKSPGEIFEHLLKGQHDKLIRIHLHLRFRLANLADAEDLAQEILILFWENLNTNRFEWKSDASMAAYLFGIARHQWSKELRRRRREHAALSDIYWQEETAPPNQEAVCLSLTEQQTLDAFASCMANLDERSKRLLVGHYAENKSYEALAAELGFASGQVARQRAYIKKKEVRNALRNQTLNNVSGH